MTPFVQFVTAVFSLGVIAGQIFIVAVIADLLILGKAKRSSKNISAFASKHILGLGLFINIVAILVSLFYSFVVGFEPCTLCWWQRILMFPQLVLFATALYYKRRHGLRYPMVLATSAILSVIGLLVGAYQYYAQMFNPSLLAACAASGPSCAKIFFTTFGYITIPMMSLTGFAFILVILAARYFVPHEN